MFFKKHFRTIICAVLFLVAVCFALLINVNYNAKNEPSATEIAEDAIETVSDPKDVFSIAMNPNRDYLIIVNDQNEYNFDGPYNTALQSDLIYVSDIYGEPNLIEKGAYLAFNMLQQKLHDQGVEISLFSGYRTKEDQQEVYDYYGHLEGWADTNRVLKPGFSEHHTGLLFNIVIWGQDEEGNMTWMTETAERQATHPEFKVVHENLADFGFIDRYPAGKEDITGLPCEPYEIRFVGSSLIAHEIMDNNLCLEEYVSGK